MLMVSLPPSFLPLAILTYALLDSPLRNFFLHFPLLPRCSGSHRRSKGCLRVFRHLLFLPPAARLSRWRTVSSNPTPRPPTQTTRLPCLTVQSRDRRQRPFHVLVPQAGYIASVTLSFTFPYYIPNTNSSFPEYVQIKPVLAVVTLILKATDTYRDGDFRRDAGYLYVTIIYNISICIALYSLAVFWMVINDDVKPFRPMPKFLCIKGILFFCFWQGITISFLVSPLHLITHIGPYTDVEHISIAISDVLICFEMPFFAVAHMYAFSHTDYIDPHVHYAARLRFWYAVRDAFGLRDVVEDSKATLHSTVNYRTYEPVEGGMHVGVGRDRRIRAGLRYAKGGAQKYWLPMLEDDDAVASTATGPLAAVQRRWDEYQGYAPVPAEEAADVVHEGFTEPDPNASMPVMDSFTPGYNATDEDDLDLRFSSPNENGNQAVEAAYEDSRKLVFGDYNYPVVDVSTEAARRPWRTRDMAPQTAVLDRLRMSTFRGTGRTARARKVCPTRPFSITPRRRYRTSMSIVSG